MNGMQHARRLAHREEAEGWDGSMVDPRAHLGVTRCTLALSVVEVAAETCAAHFKVTATAAGAGAAAGGAVRAAAFVGTALCADQPSNAVVEPAPTDGAGLRHPRVGVAIDLAAPPAPTDLATAGVLSFATVTRRLWEGSAFRWGQCRARVLELKLWGAFQATVGAGDDGTVAALLGDVLEPAALAQLGNRLPRLPGSIGNLAALTVLHLDQNQLTSSNSPSPSATLSASQG